MQINPYSQLTSALSALSKSNDSETTATSSFQDLLTKALGDAVEADLTDKSDTAALLAGVDVELHDSMLASSKAELTLNLAIQIRNKVVDAYNEVMRMQV